MDFNDRDSFFREVEKRTAGFQRQSPEANAEEARARVVELFGPDNINWPAWALTAGRPSTWAHSNGYCP